MKNKAKITLGLLALFSIAGCSQPNNPELSAEQVHQNIFNFANKNYEIAALTGDENALDLALDNWEDCAEKRDINAINSLISFYADTRNAKKLKYWNEYKILTENELLKGRINGSILVGNRSAAISTSAEALIHMQKNLKKVEDLDEKALIKLVNKVIEKADDNEKKYELMSNLAIYHIKTDPLKRREIIEKLLNDAFAKDYYQANDVLCEYYLEPVKDAQLAKNTLDRFFVAELSDKVLKALIAKNMNDDAYVFFKKHVKEAPDSSMSIMTNLYKNDTTKLYDLIKTRFLALENWAKSADFVKYQKDITKYIEKNPQDGFAHYMAAYTYELSKDIKNGEALRNHLDKAIELGCTLAYTKLAELYAEGKYVELDYLKAFELFKKAEVENYEYSIAKQKQLLQKIPFSGKSKLDIAKAKLDFYSKLKEMSISDIDALIETAKKEQKAAFLSENSRNLNSLSNRIKNNINNLGNAKDSFTKICQKNASARNIELSINSYEKILKSLEEDLAKLSEIIKEASTFDIDYLALDEDLSKVFAATKATIAKGNADLAKMKDGSLAAESAVREILSDPQAGSVNPEIISNYAIIKEVEASFDSSTKKLNQLYLSMQRASRNKNQKEAKNLLAEIEVVKPKLVKYDNALAALTSTGGVNESFISDRKAQSKQLSDYISKIEAEAKKNADTPLDSLLKFF